MRNGYSTYSTANIDTADQGKLILIAYDVAIKHCKMAIDKFDDRKLIEERTKHLFKVQDAIGELMGALKLDAGDIAVNLYKLYDYMIRRLVQATVKNDPECVKEVVKYLEDLRDAWRDAIKKIKSETVPDTVNTQPGTLVITG